MTRGDTLPIAPGDREPQALSRWLSGLRSPILWGVLFLVLIESTLLVLFVVSFLYLRLGTPEWPPPGVGDPDLVLATSAQLLLLASAAPAWLALRWLARNDRGPFLASLATGLLAAAAYPVLKVLEYRELGYGWDAHAYGSLNWTMTWYSVLHVVILLLAGATFWVLGLRGHIPGELLAGTQGLVLYWFFVTLGSLLFWATQYGGHL